jgi:hypothetical protein
MKREQLEQRTTKARLERSQDAGAALACLDRMRPAVLVGKRPILLQMASTQNRLESIRIVEKQLGVTGTEQML